MKPRFNRSVATAIVLAAIVVATGVSAAQRTNLLIVGAGTAGLPAALTAAKAGIKVTLLEKMPYTGGSLTVSGATIAAANTKFSEGLDLGDSPDRHFFETLKMGDYKNDPVLLKLLTDNAGSSINWLSDLGVAFKDNRPDFATEHALYDVPRTYTIEKGAASVAKLLTDKVKEAGVELLLNTRVVELIQNRDGRVIGVWAVEKDGKFVRFEADAVLLTAGGFAANIDMLKQFKPGLNEAFTVACPSNTGDGIRMGRSIGAATTNMNYFSCYPWALDRGNGAFTSGAGRDARLYGAIHVNADGLRFVNELAEPAIIGEKVVLQKGSTNFILMDRAMVESMYAAKKPVLATWNTLEKFEAEAEAGKLVAKSDTVAGLASRLGIDPAALTATVERYNSFVASGRDEDFGRATMQAKLENGPFYAVQTYIYTMSSMGGLKVNGDFQVLGTNGEPIPGLFAAGMTAGGVHGERMGSGNGLGWGITSGRLAGSHIATAIGK